MLNFEYILKKSSGRNIRIKIDEEGKVYLYKPIFVPLFVAERFLKSKSDWVERKVGEVRERRAKEEKEAAKGVAFRRLTKSENRKLYLQEKENARILVDAKLEYWKKFYIENFGINFIWKKFAIKNTSTRWGSCSSKKNLNFSYKIFFLNKAQQDYLIVHELAHLLEMNHGKNFWKIVGLGILEYKKLSKELRGKF